MKFPYLQAIVENCPSVSLRNYESDYPFLEVVNHSASATIALHGAHLTSFTPKGAAPVIFTSDKAIFKEGKAIRGGIPICWPWFSGHPDNPSLPAHGIARNRFWTLISISESDNSTIIELTLPLSEDDHIMIGGKVTLMARITIASSLSIELTTSNESSNNIHIGGALHSYFFISDISSIKVEGLNNTTQYNSLTAETSINPNVLTFDSEFDSVFLKTSATTIIEDLKLNRSIVIEKSNSEATCVWNPWIDKSAGMTDLEPNDYYSFICIEALNWRDDLRQLKPGESHTLSQHISLK